MFVVAESNVLIRLRAFAPHFTCISRGRQLPDGYRKRGKHEISDNKKFNVFFLFEFCYNYARQLQMFNKYYSKNGAKALLFRFFDKNNALHTLLINAQSTRDFGLTATVAVAVVIVESTVYERAGVFPLHP